MRNPSRYLEELDLPSPEGLEATYEESKYLLPYQRAWIRDQFGSYL